MVVWLFLNSTIIFEPIHARRNLPRVSVAVEVESQTQIDSSDAVEADSEDADDRENDEGDVSLEYYGLPLLRCRPGSYEVPLLRILEAETTLTGSSAYGQVSSGNLRVYGAIGQHTYYAEMASRRHPNTGTVYLPPTGHIDFDHDTPPSGPFLCLLVLQCFGRSGPNTCMYFLIIEPTGMREAEYRRIGMGYASEEWLKNSEWKELAIF